MTVKETIADILSKQIGIKDISQINFDKTLTQLNADSLDIVEIILEIEEEFDFEIPEEDIKEDATVGDLVKYIENRLENK